MDAQLQETIDYIAIRRLQSSYADKVTRRAWAEFADIFLPDTKIVVNRQDGEPYRLENYKALEGFITKAIGHMDFFRVRRPQHDHRHRRR